MKWLKDWKRPIKWESGTRYRSISGLRLPFPLPIRSLRKCGRIRKKVLSFSLPTPDHPSRIYVDRSSMVSFFDSWAGNGEVENEYA
jgi:hypothetical protein